MGNVSNVAPKLNVKIKLLNNYLYEKNIIMANVWICLTSMF